MHFSTFHVEFEFLVDNNFMQCKLYQDSIFHHGYIHPKLMEVDKFNEHLLWEDLEWKSVEGSKCTFLNHVYLVLDLASVFVYSCCLDDNSWYFIFN